MIARRGAARQLLSLIVLLSLPSWACGLTSRGEFDGLVPRPHTGVGGASCASLSDPHRPECAAGGATGTTAGTGGLMQGGASGVEEAAGESEAGTAAGAGAGEMPASDPSSNPLKTGVEVRSGAFVVGGPNVSSGGIRVLGSFVAFSPDFRPAGSRVVVRGAFK
jgi:hypothetical protein